MAGETIFDKILKKELPAEVVYEDEDVLGFRDINPQAPTHALVIPKKKITDFNELSASAPDEIGRFFVGVAKVAAKLGLSENGYRVVLNCGRDGMQTVDYLHAHILGGRQMKWPPG